MLICWGGTGIVAALTLAKLDDLDLVSVFMSRENLNLTAFNAMGLSWLLIAFLSYAVGDLAAQTTCGRTSTPAPPLRHSNVARLTFCLNLILLGVTLTWVLIGAAKAGGLVQLAAAVYLDSLSTRDLLLESKLFTGMRLFYAALPATACLAAGLLATGSLTPRARRMMWATLLLNTAALFVLPIVMSQRLLLLQLLLSAYIVACIVRGRIFGLGWLALGIALFLSLWVAREAITNPLFDRSPLDIAGQKLAFYVVNDMWNAFAPLSDPIPHTYGALSFEGLMFFTLTDGYFAAVLAPTMERLDAVIGGGEFPLLTSAYVDFGPIGGALFLALAAFVIRVVFARASRSVGWAAVYAQFGAALLFSSHSVYFTHQNFIFSLMLMWAVMKLANRTPAPLPARAEVPVLPDTIMRHMAIFRTHQGHDIPFASCRTDAAREQEPTRHEPV